MSRQNQTKQRAWFAGVTDPDQLKDLYRALALQHHPDRGGDTAVMQALNSQYDQARKRLEAPAPERKYSPPPPPKQEDNNPLSHEARMAADLVVHFCPGCWAEIRDGEVLVRGAAYDHREMLKRLGFWWSPELRAWHFVRRPGASGKGAA